MLWYNTDIYVIKYYILHTRNMNYIIKYLYGI